MIKYFYLSDILIERTSLYDVSIKLLKATSPFSKIFDTVHYANNARYFYYFLFVIRFPKNNRPYSGVTLKPFIGTLASSEE